MHKSKGLEARVVFLAGGLHKFKNTDVFHAYHSPDGANTRRLVTTTRKREPMASLLNSEQRGQNERLIYVALTRAMEKLYLPSMSPLQAPKSMCAVPTAPSTSTLKKLGSQRTW